MIESSSRRGRPRSEASKRAILKAAVAELRDRGYGELSIEGIAERAGVGKTTIYRWWASKAELAVEAFFTETNLALRFPETGSAREDFTLQVLQLAKLLRGQLGTAFAAMIAGARSDPSLGRAIAERWVAPRKRWGIERLERACSEGHCRAGLNIEAALDVLYGPLYARLLMSLDAPSDAKVRGYLELAMTAIFTT